IPNIQSNNTEANRWLIFLILISAFLMIIRVVSTFREVANVLPKLVLVPLFIMFAFAPSFLIYIRKLLFQQKYSFRDIYKHYLPLLIQFFVLLPYFLMNPKIFQYKVVNDEFDYICILGLMGFCGLIYNVY